jgi:lactate dehydrogenase-like 2-hydroxyacid dehydrogenase
MGLIVECLMASRPLRREIMPPTVFTDKELSRIGIGLHGKTLGVLGLGRVGSLVARIGQAFGNDDDRVESKPHPPESRRARRAGR